MTVSPRSTPWTVPWSRVKPPKASSPSRPITKAETKLISGWSSWMPARSRKASFSALSWSYSTSWRRSSAFSARRASFSSMVSSMLVYLSHTEATPPLTQAAAFWKGAAATLSSSCGAAVSRPLAAA